MFIYYRFYNIGRLRSIGTQRGLVCIGFRGKGKDVFFALLAHKRRHYSNIYYNEKTEIKNLHVLEIGVTPADMVNDTFKVIEKPLDDKVPFYVSDGGIYFPSWLDNELKKSYKSLPVTMALYRHLYNAPLHFNTQVFSRLWLLIREQAESVVKCEYAFSFLGWLFCKIYYYERWQDAEKGLKPVRVPFFGTGKTVAKIENSTRGKIVCIRYLVPKKWLTYDTRIFHKKIFGLPAPRKTKKTKKK